MCGRPHDPTYTIPQASVVCVVYAVNDAESLARLGSFWLPLIRKSLGAKDGAHGIPVCLVGNKSDTQDLAKKTLHDKDVLALAGTQGFSEVTVCVQCSATQMGKVHDVFHYAQLSAVYPVTQLYDRAVPALKPGTVDAFTRIFVICDTNKDGLLDDEELRAFNKYSFGIDVSDAELTHVKELVKADHDQAVLNGKITLEGFLALMKRFFEKAQFQTIWEILRKYGYTDDLRLNDALAVPACDIPADCAAELSASGLAFVESLFHSYKSTENSCSASQLQKMLSIVPGTTWLEQQLPMAEVSRAGYILAWQYLVLDQPKLALKYLAYLGYDGGAGGVAAAIALSGRRVSDCAARKTSRNIFVCYVCGGANASALSKALVEAGGFKIVTTDGLRGASSVTVGPVQSYTLVLKEWETGKDSAAVMADTCSNECDIVCLFSDGKSFSYASDLQSKVIVPGPQVLMVTDEGGAPVAEQFCGARRIAAPLKLSDAVGFAPVLKKIAAMAEKPVLSRMSGTSDSASGGSWGNLFAVAAGIAVVAYFIHRRGNK
jgi:Ras family protein T1